MPEPVRAVPPAPEPARAILPAPEPIRAVLLDIEGTVTPIAYVHDVLFPYARTRLPAFVADHPHDPAVVAAVSESGGVATLLAWMDADEKRTSLKALQGRIWHAGYADGVLRGQVYPDVGGALRRWHAEGVALHVYSSGSVESQKLLFRHSTADDLSPLIAGHFDTAIGPKRAAASYAAIAGAIGLNPASILFLSDMEAELDAAAAAGCATCQLVREADGTRPSARHDTAATLDGVALRARVSDVTSTAV